jgi:hypothetical protein
MRNTYTKGHMVIGLGVLVFLVAAVVFPLQEILVAERANLVHTTTLSLVTALAVSLVALVALRSRPKALSHRRRR